MSDAVKTDVPQYYDLLHLWTKFNSGFRVYSGVEAHAIHRWLRDPETGEFSPATIHGLMLSSGIGGGDPVDALDAGCGYGGTIFALQAALGGRWHGVTVSARQCAVGRKVAHDRGVADTVTFARRSYDAPPVRSYNLICAIESLIHSVDPGRTAGILAERPAPGWHLRHRRRHAGRRCVAGIRRRLGGFQDALALPGHAVGATMVGASSCRRLRRDRHARPVIPDASAIRARDIAGDRGGARAPPLARPAGSAADRRGGNRRAAAGTARSRTRSALHDAHRTQARIAGRHSGARTQRRNPESSSTTDKIMRVSGLRVRTCGAPRNDVDL